VTHDQAEALAISDTVAVMEGGKILAMGAPREIYGAPGSRFVADFIGMTTSCAAVPSRRRGPTAVAASKSRSARCIAASRAPSGPATRSMC